MVNTLAFNSCFDKGLLWAKYIATVVYRGECKGDRCIQMFLVLKISEVIW